jgi:hypothetical protein
LKGGEKYTALTLVLGSALLLSIAAIIQETYAINSTRTLAGIDESVELGNPFYVEHYQAIVDKPEALNKSSTGNFTGEGIFNGNLSVSAEGNATETTRNNDTVYIQGNAKFVTDNEDVALYNFEAIGNYNPDGTFEGRGAAVFDDGATGELSRLSNTVAIYKNQVNSNGNGTFVMWHWG